MPELKPFPALRYADTAGDMSALLAPPYDVIDELGAVALRARSPLNCVRLILPEGPEAIRYREAAETLNAWREQGNLRHDRLPSLYVYRQTFTLRGMRATRHGAFCALRLSSFEAGEVLPHERTHAGPRRDRFALTLATRAQLSPIFMITRDPDGVVFELLTRAASGVPDLSVTTPDGIAHELWAIAGDAATSVCVAAGAGSLLIADGHHRYETALAVAAELGDNVKAAFLLVYIASQRDPGLVVQPTHRILTRSPGGQINFDWPRALEEDFQLQSLGTLSAAEAEACAARQGGNALVALPSHERGEAWLAIPITDNGFQGERRRLAPVAFDELILGRMYATDADTAAHTGDLKYARSAVAALQTAAPGGCTFVLSPVTLDDVWAIASAGGRLPQKSTYFEPKVPSGLVFRTL